MTNNYSQNARTSSSNTVRSDMFPFWTDAYLADTRHLTTVQHGAYLLMMITAWRAPLCRLKDDDKTMATITGLTKAQWLKHKDVLLQFWSLNDGHWQQKRLTKEWANRQAYLEKQSQNGKKSAQVRAQKKYNDEAPKSLKDIEPRSTTVGTKPITKSQPAEAEAVADYNTSSLLGHSANNSEMDVRDKCIAAARYVLDEDAALWMPIQPVLNWMQGDDPCDLELDILPAMRQVASKGHPKNLKTFKYFYPIAIEYRDARLAGNPTPQENKNEKQRNSSTRVKSIGDRRRHIRGEVLAEFEANRMAKAV